MVYVRRFPHMQTEDELTEFKEFCRNSPIKQLRGELYFILFTKPHRYDLTALDNTDWFADKEPHPWFWGSVNKFMSRIPINDWDATRGDTNVNESAHPYTNMHTGINLSILDAIERCVKLRKNGLKKQC